MVVVISNDIRSHRILHHTPSYTLVAHPRMERPYQIQENPHKNHHLIWKLVNKTNLLGEMAWKNVLALMAKSKKLV
jgi:outer membrane protease